MVITTVEPRAFVRAKARTVTRVIVAAALATAVGAIALAVISATRSDRAGVVFAVFIAVTAVALAPVIVAQARADGEKAPDDD